MAHAWDRSYCCRPALLSRVEPQGWKRFDIANPIMDCPYGDIKRVGGDGDGGKFLCMEGILNEPGCIIYSLGSNGQYEFEEAMLKVRDYAAVLKRLWVGGCLKLLVPGMRAEGYGCRLG